MSTFVPLVKNTATNKFQANSCDSAGRLNVNIDETLTGAGNNNVGDGAVKLQTYCYGRDSINGQMKPLKLDTSGRLECSVDALEVTAETINLSTDALETLITSTNTKLDTIETSCDALISANHTDLVTIESSLQSVEGKQDTQITHLSEIEGAVETIEACVNSDKVDINIASGNITGFSTSSNQTTIIGHLDGVEGKQDTQITHLSEIEGAVETLEACVASNKVNVNISSGGTDVSGLSTHAKQDTIIGHLDGVEGKLDTIESSCDALISANHTDLIALEASLTAMEGKQDTQVSHLSEIEGAVETIEACVGSNKVNVNISSGNISGFSTSSNQTTIIGHLDGVEGKLDTIDGSINTLEACVGSSKVNVNISSGNISGFSTSALQTTLINDVADIITDTGDMVTELGNIEASLTSMESKQDAQSTLQTNILSKNTEIDTAVDAMSAKLPASLGAKANASSISTCRSTTAGAYDMSARTTIGTASTTTKLLCDSDGHLKVDVVSAPAISDVSGLSTHAKQDTIIGHLDGVEGKLDTLETTNNACQVLLGTIDSDTNDIKTAIEILDDIVLTEDTAHSSGHKGVMSLVVRQDSHSDLGADGDYVPMTVNAGGELRVTSGASVSKTTLNRTTARVLATNGSHADYTVDTGTEANFISFYLNFSDESITETDLQIQFSEASNFANPVIVFQGIDGTNPIAFGKEGSAHKRALIELKNPSRYVRVFNDNGLSTFPITNGIIIHGRE